jgi:hypothetical protein
VAELVEPHQPARLVEPLFDRSDVAERPAGADVRGVGREPLVDELLGFYLEMRPDFPIEVVVGSSSG